MGVVTPNQATKGGEALWGKVLIEARDLSKVQALVDYCNLNEPMVVAEDKLHCLRGRGRDSGAAVDDTVVVAEN